MIDEFSEFSNEISDGLYFDWKARSIDDVKFTKFQRPLNQPFWFVKMQ